MLAPADAVDGTILVRLAVGTDAGRRITAGGAETLLSDSETLHAKAKERGVKTVLSVVPGMQHVFPALSGRAPEANEELDRIADWYRNL